MPVLLNIIVQYCFRLLVVGAAYVSQVQTHSRTSPLLVLFHRHSVLSWIGLGKHSTLPSVSDLGKEEVGDSSGLKEHWPFLLD